MSVDLRRLSAILVLLVGAACGRGSTPAHSASASTVGQTSTSSTTATTASATTTTALLPGELAAFAGDWHFHGVGVHVRPDGSGQATWRIYKWCSDDPTPPCDGMDGNNIISGGQATFSITAVNGTTATATVQRSTDPHTVPTGSVTLRRQSGDHLDFNGAWQPLCGPSSPSDSCGA